MQDCQAAGPTGLELEVVPAPPHLFAIHLLTASGAALAVLAVLAILDGHWNTAFGWLGMALLVDGVDGPIARRHHLQERLPAWDGATLDNVIDYVTYVFAPAIIVRQALGLPSLLGSLAGIIIAVSGALYYADTRMKQPDNSFRGFPVVWNMVVFVLYAFTPAPATTLSIVAILAVLTFVPLNFVHPVRVQKWRVATLSMLAVWLGSAAWLLATDLHAPFISKVALLAASVYLLSVAGIQQALRKP
jgi:phosphatidylcholine synthase